MSSGVASNDHNGKICFKDDGFWHTGTNAQLIPIGASKSIPERISVETTVR